MKILKITKKGKKYQVVFDSKTIELLEDTILFFRLTKDKEIDNLDEILEKNAYYVLYDKVLRKLKIPKSSYEIRKFLEQNEISYDLQEQIILELEQKKLINDDKLINNIIEYTPKSKNQIRTKLLQKGYSDNDFDELLKSKDDMKDLERNFLKMANKYKKESIDVARKKITQSLLTKGYEYSKISNLISSLDKNDFNDYKIKDDIKKFRLKYDDDNKLIKKLLSLGYSYSDIKENL